MSLETEKNQTYESGFKDEKLKFLSAYRIYRRTEAPRIKEQRPNLNGKERQVIIRDNWKKLDPKKKYLFVLRSRWDQEKARFKNKTLEFKSQLAMFAQQDTESEADNIQSEPFGCGKTTNL